MSMREERQRQWWQQRGDTKTTSIKRERERREKDDIVATEKIQRQQQGNRGERKMTMRWQRREKDNDDKRDEIERWQQQERQERKSMEGRTIAMTGQENRGDVMEDETWRPIGEMAGTNGREQEQNGRKRKRRQSRRNPSRLKDVGGFIAPCLVHDNAFTGCLPTRCGTVKTWMGWIVVVRKMIVAMHNCAHHIAMMANIKWWNHLLAAMVCPHSSSRCMWACKGCCLGCWCHWWWWWQDHSQWQSPHGMSGRWLSLSQHWFYPIGESRFIREQHTASLNIAIKFFWFTLLESNNVFLKG